MVKLRDDLDRYAISWSDLHRDGRALTRQLLNNGPFTGIVALSRGGLVPAAIISRELGIRLIETLCIKSYDEQVQEGLEVLKMPEQAMKVEGANWLVIDDLIDSGKTMREARRLLPKATFVTLYVKTEPTGLVDHFVRHFDLDTWLFFPWDTDAVYVKPLAETDD